MGFHTTPSRTPFTIDNIPYGIISTTENPKPRCATAFEDDAVDLSVLEEDGYFRSIPDFEGRCIFGQVFTAYFADSTPEMALTWNVILASHMKQPGAPQRLCCIASSKSRRDQTVSYSISLLDC